jgi:hypothetical protein
MACERPIFYRRRKMTYSLQNSVYLKIKRLHYERVLYFVAIILSRLLFVLLALFFAITALHFLFPYMPERAGLLLSAGFYFVTIALALFSIVKIVIEGSTLSSTIHFLKKINPALAEKVVSAIQLELNIKECKTRSSDYMARVFSSEVEKELGAMPVIKLSNSLQLFLYFVAILILCSAMMFAYSVYPEELIVGFKRALMLEKNLPNVYGAAMHPTQVSDFCTRLHLPATNVSSLIIEYKDGHTEYQELTHFSCDSLTNSFLVKIPVPELLRHNRLIKYRLKSGLACSRWLMITNSYFELEIVPPLYTRLAPLRVTTTNFMLNLPCYSDMKVDYNCGRTHTNLVLIIRDGRATRVLAHTAQNALETNITLTNALSGELAVTCEAEEKSHIPLGTLNVYEDNPPLIEWLQPAGQRISAATIDKFDVRLGVQDDFAVAALDLYVEQCLPENKERYFSTNFHHNARNRFECSIPIDTLLLYKGGCTSLLLKAVATDGYPALYGGPHSSTSMALRIDFVPGILPYNCQKINSIATSFLENLSLLRVEASSVNTIAEHLCKDAGASFYQSFNEFHSHFKECKRLMGQLAALMASSPYLSVQSRLASIQEFIFDEIEKEMERLYSFVNAQDKHNVQECCQRILRLSAEFQETATEVEKEMVSLEKAELLTNLLDAILSSELSLTRELLAINLSVLFSGISGLPSYADFQQYNIGNQQKEIKNSFLNWAKMFCDNSTLFEKFYYEYLNTLSNMINKNSSDDAWLKKARIISDYLVFLDIFIEDFALREAEKNDLKTLLQLKDELDDALFKADFVSGNLKNFLYSNLSTYNFQELSNAISPQAATIEQSALEELMQNMVKILNNIYFQASMRLSMENKLSSDADALFKCYLTVAKISNLIAKNDPVEILSSLVQLQSQLQSSEKQSHSLSQLFSYTSPAGEMRNMNGYSLLQEDSQQPTTNSEYICPAEYRTLVNSYFKAYREKLSANKQ